MSAKVLAGSIKYTYIFCMYDIMLTLYK